MVKRAHFVIIFQKLCQIASFWVVWENGESSFFTTYVRLLIFEVVIYLNRAEKHENFQNMVKRAHLLSFFTTYVKVLFFEAVIYYERPEKTWKCSKYCQRSSFFHYFSQAMSKNCFLMLLFTLRNQKKNGNV